MAATPNDLLALRNQQPTELSNQADDIGGPRPTWSTADYANFSFDAARGVRQDSSAASSTKAPVGPEKSELGEDEDTDEKKDDLKEDELDNDLDTLSVSDADGDGVAEVDSDTEFLSDEDDDELNTIDLDITEEEDDDDDKGKNPFAESEDSDEDDKLEESDDEDEDDKGLTEDEDSDEDDKLEESDDEDEDDDKKGKNPFTESEDSDEDDKLEEEDDEDEDDKELAESKKPIRIKINFGESKKLFESNTTLSEEDKRSSKALFESAVRNVAKDVARQLQEAYKQRYISAVALQEKQSAKKIDKYLSYVVEQWVADNKVPLRAQLRSKLTENFLSGLKGLLEQNYVEVPKGKVDVVKALAENVKTLKTKLKLAEADNLNLREKTKKVVVTERKSVVKEHKARLIAEAARVLPLSEQQKFVEKAKTLSFKDTKTFSKDLVTLREQYKAAEGAGKERLLAVPNALPIFEERSNPAKSDVEKYAALTAKLIS